MAAAADTEERLTKVEERLAYLEALLDDSSKLIGTLEDKVQMLTEQVKILAVRQGEISAVRDLKDEVPPPHY